jgi:hypothetical protein
MFIIRLYVSLIGLGLLGAVAGAYLGNPLLLTGGAAWAVFFLSAEIGLILHEYQGMARLMAVHDKLIVASIKAQGFEIEGMTSALEEEETR